VNEIELGRFGEKKALSYLISKGYKLIGKNYHNHYGELDLIVSKNNELVFVEVKTVLKNRGFDPVEQMTHRKLYHLQNTINDYLAYYRVPPDQSYRLDYIGIIVDSANQVLKFDHRSSIGLSG